MSSIDPSAITQYISPLYFMIILVMVGFVYHLIRNNEYKDTLMASVVIGLILGLLFNSSYDLLKTFGGDIIFLILVSIGGFLAVSLKKLMGKNANWNTNTDAYEFPENQLKGDGWWSRQTPRNQTLIIITACLLCLLLIISAVSFLSTVKEPAKLTLQTPISGEIKSDNMNNKKDGNALLTFDDNTELVLKGSSETNATVKITASELGIYNQTIPLDSDSNFIYKFNVPTTGSISKIVVEASKPGKSSNTLILSLKN